MATKVKDQLGREGIVLEKLDNSPTLRKKAHWSPVTPFSTRTLQQQLEDQHESIPQAEQAYKVQFESSIEVKLESELEFLQPEEKEQAECDQCGRTTGVKKVKIEGKHDFVYLCAHCRDDDRYKVVRDTKRHQRHYGN